MGCCDTVAVVADPLHFSGQPALMLACGCPPTCISPSTALGSTTVCLLGLFLALAIFARSLLGPTPAEQV
jgi:hypothetical protein